MAIRGRKPKPTAMKEFEGNLGKRPINKNEPKPKNKAKCPTWLGKEAKKEWRRLAPYLEANNLLTEADQSAFVAYCRAWEKWVAAAKEADENGSVVTTPNGALQTSPYDSNERQWLDKVNKLGAEFGLTPSSRGRLAVYLSDRKEETDPMEELLREVYEEN